MQEMQQTNLASVDARIEQKQSVFPLLCGLNVYTLAPSDFHRFPMVLYTFCWGKKLDWGLGVQLRYDKSLWRTISGQGIWLSKKDAQCVVHDRWAFVATIVWLNQTLRVELLFWAVSKNRWVALLLLLGHDKPTSLSEDGYSTLAHQSSRRGWKEYHIRPKLPCSATCCPFIVKHNVKSPVYRYTSL